jgi:voltage-gated potassium channel
VVALLAGLVAGGTVGYRLTAGLDWLDSLYMTIITLTTVGYRELFPPDDVGAKVFTMFLQISGVGVFFYAAAVVMDTILDESTRRYFEIQRISRRTRRLNNHYVICGLGRVGRAAAEELSARGVPFLAIEKDSERVARATARGWLTIEGDATQDVTLEEAGVPRARGLVACLPTDAENLFIIVSARILNADLLVSARISDEANMNKFLRAGATHVYSPYSLLGRRIARSVTQPRVLQLLDLALEQSYYDLTIDEFRVPAESELVGKSLRESHFRSRFGAFVLSMIRADKSVVHNPPPEVVIQPEDILIMLGTPQQLREAGEKTGLVRAG